MCDLNISKLNNKEQLDVLFKLARILNQYGFKWSLGASMMLKLRGFDVTVDDLDIIIQTNEIQKLERILCLFGYKKEIKSNKYLTTHFYELLIDNVNVDIMIGFKVNTNDGIYVFDETSAIDKINFEETTIYLSSLEEWLKAYKAMNRTDKISMIEKHLIKNSI
jgi:hypothetical protein